MERHNSILSGKDDASSEFAQLKDKADIVSRSTQTRVEAHPPMVSFVKENIILVAVLTVLVILLLYYFLGIIFNILYFILG